MSLLNPHGPRKWAHGQPNTVIAEIAGVNGAPVRAHLRHYHTGARIEGSEQNAAYQQGDEYQVPFPAMTPAKPGNYLVRLTDPNEALIYGDVWILASIQIAKPLSG